MEINSKDLKMLFLKTQQIQFNQVPVTLGTETQWRSIYYLTLNDIKTGDHFEFYAEGQIRNDLGYNIELAQVFEIKSHVSGGKEPLDGLYQGPINGWNVDPVMHYGRFSKGDIWMADKDYPVLYFLMRLRCRSTGAMPSDYVTVNAGQGLMYLIKHNING